MDFGYSKRLTYNVKRVMRSKSLCEKNKSRVMAAVGVAAIFTLSLYYPGSGSWSFRQDARGYLMSRFGARLSRETAEKRNGTPTVPIADWYDPTEESSHFVLNTIGCKIPNVKVGYTANMSAYDSVCGERIVHLKKINETHAQFSLADSKWKSAVKNCTFKFVYRSSKPRKENLEIRFSPNITFTKNITFKLEGDFIMLKCSPRKNHKLSDSSKDAFAVVRKRNIPSNTRDLQPNAWNVLVIGMDTMSRARMLNTMQRTVSYFHHHQWIDFKGYQKIADNTWPNLMAVLTGKKRSTFDRACSGSMDACGHMLMWSKYRKAGYVTAYGEDHLRLPDTFASKGFKQPPTDHYMRPFFLTGERLRPMRSKLITVCTGTKSSGEQVLDYALDFVQTYKKDPFFGFFWINSNSHNEANMPQAIDAKLSGMFQHLRADGTLNNTFVVFLSDHGVRFGRTREPMESYYDERLPALFMWAPTAFREELGIHLENLVSNRLRLVTPYDLYMTLEDILKISSGSNDSATSEACPECRSLFNPISSERTCRDAAVEEKWCSCHSLDRMAQNDKEGIASVNSVLTYIHNFSSHLETKKCTKCEKYKLHSILRMHSYYNRDKSVKYMVVAFMVSPGPVGYEATVAHDGSKYEITGQISIISPHFGRGYCVKNSKVSMFCYCTKTKKCNST